MKRFIVGLLAFAVTPVLADTPVNLQLVGLSGNDGQVVVSVYDSKKAWLKEPVVREIVDATGVSDGQMTVTIDLPPGEYAVHIYHDLDADGEMKANFVGIPKEPTGVSRDAKGRFGPPKFKDAMFAVGDESMSMTINIVSI